MPPIIQLKQLKKQYNPPSGPQAVKGIDLEIQEGEVFSLLGPNGAGKTTTISMMSGLLTPSGGQAVIAGHDITREPMAAKAAIGVVPQEIALYPTLSPKQNLRFFGQLYGLRGGALSRSIDEVLNITGLADRANDKVETFSGGMKRRLNIGVGLLHKPRIIFMDEPTVGIDPQSRRRILDTVMQLKKDYGMTVLYTTHYMEEAQEISDRVGIIDNGQIIALGTTGELIQKVGEEDKLQLRVGEQQVPETVMASMKQVEGVTNITQRDGDLTVTAKRGRRALPDLLTIANDAGIDIMSVAVQEPDLEAVFLHLTGRALRE